MSLFNTVSFGPSEVRAVMQDTERKLPRCTVMAVLTSQTCGEPCWHAREEVCRCSCGGRNHGCLLIPGGERPERTAKIDGERYKLAGVGRYEDLEPLARKINGQQWRALEKPTIVCGSRCVDYKPEEIEAARARGEEVYFQQYYYSWSATDVGAPARLKTATKDQLAKWTELQGWQNDARHGVYLLWEIVTMPIPPTQLRVGRNGEPLKNQTPNGEQI